MKLATLNPIVPSKDLFFGNMFDSLFSDTALHSNGHETIFQPSANILENEKTFQIFMALPGLKKEDVQIDLHENTLTVSGVRNFKKEENKGTWHFSEIKEGQFSRSFIVPENILFETIEANFTNGMLEIVLPKAEPKQAKTITIK